MTLSKVTSTTKEPDLRTRLIYRIDEGGFEWEEIHADLDAIEAEAIARHDAELRERIEAMPHLTLVDRAAVLALLPTE